MVGNISTFDRFARLYDLAMPGAKAAALEREFDPTTLRGRGLVAAEIDDAGFEAAVVDSGFGDTVVGLTESETHNTTERLG